MNDFYVYAWTRPDTGDVFYIGKGRRKRDIAPKVHNPFFMNIIEKMRRLGLKPTVARIFENLSEQDALDVERIEIGIRGRRALGAGSLVNLTDGGDGLSGYKHTTENLERMRASRRRRKMAPLSEITRAKLSAGSLGVEKTAEHVEKIGSAQRRSAPRRDNSTGFKGVSFHKIVGKYCASIFVNGTTKHLGSFTTAEEAATVYDRAAYAAWGSDCYINFPVAAAS